MERPSIESLVMDFAMGLTRRATCKRAQFSCVIAAEDMTQIYGFGYNGTARGFAHDDCKADQPGNCGCFVAGTSVATDRGRVEIQRIRQGDRVLTHENRLRPVTQTLRHEYAGELVELFLDTSTETNLQRRKTATAEHPFLVRRGGVVGWCEAQNIQPGDHLAVLGKDCPGCGKRIPTYRRSCERCLRESAHTAEFRKQHGDRMRRNNPMRGFYDPSRSAILQALAHKDTTRIACEQLVEGKQEYEAKGWYNGHPDVGAQHDDITWRRKYDVSYAQHNEAFVWTRVSLVTSRLVRQPVFNLEVGEDNSYVAQSAAVHNCVHAEINALIKVRVNDPRKVVFVTGQPCVTCAKAIINSGASKIYYRSAYRSDEGLELFKKAGIEIERV